MERGIKGEKSRMQKLHPQPSPLEKTSLKEYRSS
jgi:hypothetical protein